MFFFYFHLKNVTIIISLYKKKMAKMVMESCVQVREISGKVRNFFFRLLVGTLSLMLYIGAARLTLTRWHSMHGNTASHISIIAKCLFFKTISGSSKEDRQRHKSWSPEPVHRQLSDEEKQALDMLDDSFRIDEAMEAVSPRTVSPNSKEWHRLGVIQEVTSQTENIIIDVPLLRVRHDSATSTQSDSVLAEVAKLAVRRESGNICAMHSPLVDSHLAPSESNKGTKGNSEDHQHNAQNRDVNGESKTQDVSNVSGESKALLHDSSSEVKEADVSTSTSPETSPEGEKNQH